MKRKSIYLCSLLACTLIACGPKDKGDGQTLYSGEITIAVDETLKPIVEEELQVYQALTPEATVCKSTKLSRLRLPSLPFIAARSKLSIF